MNISTSTVFDGYGSQDAVDGRSCHLDGIFSRKTALGARGDQCTVFFAKILRTASEEEVKTVFSTCGQVMDVILFRAHPGASTTKGCGLVAMREHEEAERAISVLDRKFYWNGMLQPMVVKWMDASLNSKRRNEMLVSSLSLPSSLDPAILRSSPSLLPAPISLSDIPPAGCTSDALKLFVGNIPLCYSEDDLRPVFAQLGKVVELVLVRERSTNHSKGSAFVWYSTRAAAEQAIMQFNARHVLSDPTGLQDRPLAVRCAKLRGPPASKSATAASLRSALEALNLGAASAAAPPLSDPMPSARPLELNLGAGSSSLPLSMGCVSSLEAGSGTRPTYFMLQQLPIEQAGVQQPTPQNALLSQTQQRALPGIVVPAHYSMGAAAGLSSASTTSPLPLNGAAVEHGGLSPFSAQVGAQVPRARTAPAAPRFPSLPFQLQQQIQPLTAGGTGPASQPTSPALLSSLSRLGPGGESGLGFSQHPALQDLYSMQQPHQAQELPQAQQLHHESLQQQQELFQQQQRQRQLLHDEVVRTAELVSHSSAPVFQNLDFLGSVMESGAGHAISMPSSESVLLLSQEQQQQQQQQQQHALSVRLSQQANKSATQPSVQMSPAVATSNLEPPYSKRGPGFPHPGYDPTLIDAARAFHGYTAAQ